MSSKNSSKKAAKAKIPDRNLRVTDFFTRRPAQASGSSVVSSQPSSVALATRSRQSHASKSSAETSVTISNKQTMTPILSASHTSTSSGSATLLSPPHTASRTRSSACQTPTGPMVTPRITRSHAARNTPRRVSQKRPRSPDQSLGASHLLSASKAKLPHKRKKKFESDSESERPSGVIYVQNPSSPFKPSVLAPPLTGPRTPSSSKHLIYSSQSDEMELVVPILDTRSLSQVNEQVYKWRQTTLASPSSSVINDSSPCDSGVTDAGLPAPHHFPPHPASDKAAKAAQLIASIKAKAFAESPLSDEEKNYKFRELDESSDDDLENMSLLPDKKGKGKSSHLPVLNGMDGIFDSPLSSVSSSPPKPSTSYNLRNRRSPSASPTCAPVDTHRMSRSQVHTRSGRTSKPAPPLRLPTIVVTKNAPGPSKLKNSFNPLEALLREKKAAEKRGNGSAAFLRAENALQAHISSDVNLEDDLNLADEGAAWQAIQEHAQRKSSSPMLEPLEDDVFMGERETKILGREAGEKIEKILVSDKNSKSKKPKGEVVGVPFWQEGADDDGMVIDEEYNVSFGGASNHPVLALLQHLGEIGAADKLALTLSSGVLGALGPEEKYIVVSPLFALAISLTESRLSGAAYSALRGLWSATSYISKSVLRFTDIATALVNLGACRHVAEDLRWTIREDVHPLHITAENRSRVLSKLVTLVGIAGRTENLVAEDIPDVLLSLVLIGLDRTTSNELRANLHLAIDSICRTINTSTHLSIHQRLLSHASTLTPANKAYFVSFFSSGSGRTRHIAQWLAYALFLPNSIPSDALPPLDPLILLLSPIPGSDELFDVTSANADFEDLGHYFAIISVALANIEAYVHEEHSSSQLLSRQSSIDDSPRKSQKPLAPLELLLRVLEVTQGRIVDTRAAHLDRSRTKAEMHRLQMRVYYQTPGAQAPRSVDKDGHHPALLRPQVAPLSIPKSRILHASLLCHATSYGMLTLFYTHPLRFCIMPLSSCFPQMVLSFNCMSYRRCYFPVSPPAAVTYCVHYSMPIVDEFAVNQL
ncbi:hypothetical protein DFJ58DRAFT_917053 [Suillus subalutaceus]|uniref:uncharacterized protein n=1 Tax=Suillus subalutaceus TaxID=48586 RepID=UPI001B86BE09|nr:uncharacterized protein DFJ58DRAFT_917053 [Suillus subalutaceus]KAG1839013.1 hypothetical protein DFJ58DRAFT_917053 [Suillus subalutaceus]